VYLSGCFGDCKTDIDIHIKLYFLTHMRSNEIVFILLLEAVLSHNGTYS